MTIGAKPAAADVARLGERHYSPIEVGKILNVSARTARRMFEKEPGVLRIGEGSRVTLRIPQSVLERVYRRRCNT